MRALPRSYGDISSFTRSPTVSRINPFRILPEIWARTRCWLESSTRNIVPGRTVTIFPSVTIESSVGINRIVNTAIRLWLRLRDFVSFWQNRRGSYLACQLDGSLAAYQAFPPEQPGSKSRQKVPQTGRLRRFVPLWLSAGAR